MSERPRVGISRCLLGDEVRFDGTHKRDETLVGALSPHVEWIPVCPEVEIGMGTPREPIHLVAWRDGVPSLGERVRLIGVASGEDWTERMQAWARDRVRQLLSLGLSGYILKASSPSCGIDNVRVDHNGQETRTGRGLFAQALVEAIPDLPVADEEQLRDPDIRARFLERIRAFHER